MAPISGRMSRHGLAGPFLDACERWPHQDPMVPMELLALYKVTGEDRHPGAAVCGLGSTDGSNDLGRRLLDRERGRVLEAWCGREELG